MEGAASKRSDPSFEEGERPFRDEILSTEQLERHANVVAELHTLCLEKTRDKLLPRLDDNERILKDTYDLITIAVEQNRRIAPAAEWLLDNFYLIEEQIRSTRSLLPSSYSGELPRLANTSVAHYPRAYGIAIELISHTDGRVDTAALDGFVSAYQRVTALKLGELWALPLMLRLALIENLRRVASRISKGRIERDLAAYWATKMIATMEQNPTDLILVLADMARANPTLSGAFLADLMRHLQGQTTNFGIANSWLEQRLALSGNSIEQLILDEGQSQAADQVSVGNSIISLRFLSVHDWRQFVGDQSIVEKTLHCDPSGVFSNMDFATRNRYRHAVEAIAKRAGCSEVEVAKRAVQLAQAEAVDPQHERSTHVGYFLIDRGRPALERLVHMRLTPSVAIEKFRRAFPLTIYLGTAILVAFVAACWFCRSDRWIDYGYLPMWLMAVPMAFCCLQLGITVTNWIATLVIKPVALPRMDFQYGIPEDSRTLIAIPTMLTSESAVHHLLEALELRYLANRDKHLHFALVTDFPDAETETTISDAALVEQAVQGIERLNCLYCEEQSPQQFHLLHRSRTWNTQEKIWMGYERKRGKLADLNATLRGSVNRFSVMVGDLATLQQVRYVITLDSDTQLPFDAARKMIEAMSHPLNRPVPNESGVGVSAGYTILQPRVGVSPKSSQRSWFVRLFGEPGIDPYTRLVSDLYQDLFQEGSFIGKGIYDVDAFEKYCGNFPENAILSHDLLEGCYARAAVISDVILYEDFPSSYAVDAGRRHRWIRGDWQIAGWLAPRVRQNALGRGRNPLTALCFWKIFDNLRRSLMPIAILILLAIGWLALPLAGGLMVTFFVLTMLAAPHLLPALVDLFRKPTGVPVFVHCVVAMHAIARHLLHALYAIVFVPYDAYLSADAILRTLYRVHFSHQRMLEWKTSSDAERATGKDLASFSRAMIFAPIMSAILILLISIIHAQLLYSVLPILALWLASPVLAWQLSREIPVVAYQLKDAQRLFLRKLARKTYRYFETYVNESENGLPPDNVQFNQSERIASRTSPTNIGMALLADLTALDLGYCNVSTLMARTSRTLDTLSKMERYHGHFYNWYDTRSLSPLLPRYVSTVDSGNFLGHLRVLSSGIRELTDAKTWDKRCFEGLTDTLTIRAELESAILDSLPAENSASERKKGVKASQGFARILAELRSPTSTAGEAISRLERMDTIFQSISTTEDGGEDQRWWTHAFADLLSQHSNDLKLFSSWMVSPIPVSDAWVPESQEQKQLWSSFRVLYHASTSANTLREIVALPDRLTPSIDALSSAMSLAVQATTPESASLLGWLASLRQNIATASTNATLRIQSLEHLALRCDETAVMDFDFLKSKSMKLFAIGFNATENRLDSSCYDMLASEARLVTFVLIASGELDTSHWFSLGRLLTTAAGEPALLSWSGSMFEYLMPLLVMPTYDHTLLDQTYRAVVKRQIRYGRQRGVPWGISESGYNTVDLHLNYQYRAFGVPGLGLKRGLAEDLVIAPYASAMALMIAPEAACRNLERLTDEGQSSGYGLYEAIDFTPSRLPPGVNSVTIKQVMAHHAGMSLLSFAYVLCDKPMQRRFEADPSFRSADLLLHERIPRATVPVYPHATEANATRSASAEEAGIMRIFTDPNSPTPEVHLLSNGRYHVAISSAGGGYSRCEGISVSRWREDSTRDCWGLFCYLRDVETGETWSTSYQPTCKVAMKYEAIFTQSRAEFRRIDDEIETYTLVTVATDDDLELRRTKITNRSDRPRTIEVTSYAEVVLAALANDEAHPAFSNLFVQTEILPTHQAIVSTRRRRSAEENPPWMIHMMTATGNSVGEASYETDRMRFLGRGRHRSDPMVFDDVAPLSNTQGATLDPIVSIRHTFLLQPNESAQIDLVTGVSKTREGVIEFAEKYRDTNLTDRVFELAWTRGPILLQQLNATESDAQAYGRLCGSIIYPSSYRRAKSSILCKNRRSQSSLWSYGISGDLPIVLVRIRDHERIELVRQAIQAHAYWRMKGLPVDLVIWNEDDSVYRQSLQEAIMDLLAASTESALVDRPGGVFVRRGEQMSDEDRILLQTVARVVLSDDAGSLADQANRRCRSELMLPAHRPTKKQTYPIRPSAPAAKQDLAYFNGLGGFSQDGREYVITQMAGQSTPAPWVNVIANESIGTVISESGSCYTWVGNSHEFRITPWNNDPVSDTCGEAIYIRDEETGRIWSAAPAPARGTSTYVTRHGFGYSIFDCSDDGIVTELCVYVAIDSPIKFSKLKISNQSGRPRQLSVTSYSELVLGESRSKSQMHIGTEVDPVTNAVFARNPYSSEFSEQVAFFDCSESVRTITCDRCEFIGRNGDMTHPAALLRTRLSGKVGSGLDPCVAMQTVFELDVGQERTVVFTMGAAENATKARQLVQRHRGLTSAHRAIEGVWHYWSQTLGAVHVETPDASLNYLANGWLLYQTLACRMWARTGFYQSGGAYGFRDQLQDAMALVHSQPSILREQLLRAAGRQFREGDVQHWWHPPVGRGVRTHFSDDFLWLPLAVCRYVSTTGDTGLLDERVPFLTTRLLHDDEEANYDLPQVSADIGSLYEHAQRALDHALRFGEHGLPLMGCGDWNDGMNLVGQHGKGESVWLGFFLYDVLNQFADLASQRGDAATTERYHLEANRIRGNIEESAWDGQWYRRAYFDDGTPLGSAENEECQIDSISQSWSILSGAGTSDRAITAMNSLDRRLVRRDDRLIQLLDPPFDHSALNPGYIKGYVPGVRENGGQYTHAAIWTIMAFAAMKDNDRAWELFRMINPISHGATPDSIAKYRVEPYVVAADVYAVAPHIGRGGWTWYTGSAGWMYRLISESLLGLELNVDRLLFHPRPPRDWTSYKIHYRYRETFYHITFLNCQRGSNIERISMDGVELPNPWVTLTDDRGHHTVDIELG